MSSDIHRYWLGIDMGATNTATAAADAQGVSVLPADGDRVLLRTIVGIADDGTLVCGTDAEQVMERGRVVADFRSRLGDPTPVIIDSSPYSAAALLATVLRRAVDSATAGRGGRPPEQIALCCPSGWGRYRREQLAEVVVLAGVPNAKIVDAAEVIAAGHFVAHDSKVGDLLAVFDFGGTSLDVAVVRRGVDGAETIGHPGGIERLGGADIDRALRVHLLASAEMSAPGSSSGIELEQRQLSVCRQAKERLSTVAEVSFVFPVAAGNRSVKLRRSELQELIVPLLRPAVQALRDVVRAAECEPAELSGIVISGGSSMIPVVAEQVGNGLATPVTAASFPQAAGAIAACSQARRQTSAPHEVPRLVVHGAHKPRRVTPNRRSLIPIVAIIALVVAVAATVAVRPSGRKAPAGELTTATTVPAAAPSSGSASGEVTYYVVQKEYNGVPEFLFGIAQRFLGFGERSSQIFALNKGRLQPDGRQMINPNIIDPGWFLILPADAQGAGVHRGSLPCCADPAPKTVPPTSADRSSGSRVAPVVSASQTK